MQVADEKHEITKYSGLYTSETKACASQFQQNSRVTTYYIAYESLYLLDKGYVFLSRNSPMGQLSQE